MTGALRKFVVVAAFVDYVPDAFLTATLEDDRVALCLDSLKETVRDEFVFVCSVSAQTWETLASFCDLSPSVLRHLVVGGSLRAVGFLTWRVFRAAESLPWSLVRGDIQANLGALQASGKPKELTARKIYHLACTGESVELLSESVQLLAECSWSSKMSEQAHAPVTRLNRLHKEYQASTLSNRACLNSMQQLFTPTEAATRYARADAKLQALRRKTPTRIGGRQAYNKAMIEESTRQRKLGKSVALDMGKQIIAGTGTIYKEMDDIRKAVPNRGEVTSGRAI